MWKRNLTFNNCFDTFSIQLHYLIEINQLYTLHTDEPKNLLAK